VNHQKCFAISARIDRQNRELVVKPNEGAALHRLDTVRSIDRQYLRWFCPIQQRENLVVPNGL
jgi:hypothetical protein